MKASWHVAELAGCVDAVVLVQVCTAKMNLSEEVDLEDYVSRPDKISAADVSGKLGRRALELALGLKENGNRTSSWTELSLWRSPLAILAVGSLLLGSALKIELSGLSVWLSRSSLCVQISSICQEAGMHAVRKNRYVILPKDFDKGYRTTVKKSDTEFEFYK